MKKISILLLVLTLGSCAMIRKQVELAGQQEKKFTVDHRSFQVEAGEIEVQFSRVFPMTGLIKEVVNVSYFPAEDAVCLRYRFNGITYHHYWSRAGRQTFIRALNNYNDDYTTRNLDKRKNSRRTKSVYGTAEGYLMWQLTSMSARRSGNMDVELGYSFKEDSPFFTVTQMTAIYYDITRDPEKDDSSPEIPILFTRAQAMELADLFDQGFLLSLVPEAANNPATGRSATIETDDY